MPDNQPLKGIRVIDFTQLLPGPLCSVYLADMGADVIKVEPPGPGDPVRANQSDNPMFAMLNRNKRSLQIDLHDKKEKRLIKALADTADVVIEGFRPGVAERLGIGWPQLVASNPKLVYCSITGYGQHGPLAQRAGHDINYQSLAGVLEQSGSIGTSPAQGNFPVADLAGGALSATTGILAALFDAARSGQGRYVDISMSDCLLALNLLVTASWQNSGQVPARGEDFLSGGVACYRTYRTADQRYLAVGAVEYKFWKNFCDAIKRPDLYDKGHIQGPAGVEAANMVTEIISSRNLAHWVDVFSTIDACVSPVLRIDEVVEHPHIKARGMVRRVTHPQGGVHMQYACPLRMGDAPWPAPIPAPALGADNAAIGQELGMA